MLDNRESRRRSAAAAAVLIVAGFLISVTYELVDVLSEALPLWLYVIVGIIAIMIGWGMITLVIYQIQEAAPDQRVRLAPGEIERIARAIEEETEMGDTEVELEEGD